jgi:peptidoglycan/LPS O-acetylase OafA/YrhL
MRTLCRRLFQEPVHELNHPPAAQVPALDAARALAVLMVIACHYTEAYLQQGGAENLFSQFPLVSGGWRGVDLFFVLSGLLIGKQLWREFQKTRTIHFSRFVLRRGLRIWPLYFFFLVLVAFVLGRGSLPFGRWWSDAVFLTNYFRNEGVILGGWSLCTEEQFYILAPLLIIFAAMWLPSLPSYRKYLWGLLVLLPVLRAVIWWCYTGNLFSHDIKLFSTIFYEPIHAHSDGLVLGLVLAHLEATDGDKYKSGFFASGWCVLAALGACIVLIKLHYEVLNHTGTALFFGALVWFLLSKRRAWLVFLNRRVFYVVSRLSFGMYLNHGYLHEGIAAFALKYVPLASTFPAWHTLVTFMGLVVLSAGLAVVTFCLVEYPFLQLRDKMLSRKAAASAVPPARQEGPSAEKVLIPG